MTSKLLSNGYEAAYTNSGTALQGNLGPWSDASHQHRTVQCPVGTVRPAESGPAARAAKSSCQHDRRSQIQVARLRLRRSRTFVEVPRSSDDGSLSQTTAEINGR
jgi:hypothetical protein